MARTVLPCAGDLSRTARNPRVPEMPYAGGVQSTRPAALPQLQSALPDRRRHPGDAHRGSKTRKVDTPLRRAGVLARVLRRWVSLGVADVTGDLVVRQRVRLRRVTG